MNKSLKNNLSSDYVRICIGALMLMIAATLTTSGFALFLVPITESMNIHRAAFGLCSTLIMLPGAAVSLFAERIFRFTGARRFIIIGMIWGALGFGLFAVSNSLYMFYFASLFLGCIASVSTTFMGNILVNDWFIKYRSAVIGIAASGSGIGGVVYGLVFPGIISRFGWRVGFVAMAVCWCVLMLTGIILIRGTTSELGMKPLGYTDDIEDVKEGASGINKRELMLKPEFFMLMFALMSLCIVNGVYQNIQANLQDYGYTLKMAGYAISLYNALLIFLKISMGVAFEKLGLKKALIIPMSIYFLSFSLLLLGPVWIFFPASVFLSTGSCTVSLVPAISAGIVYDRRQFAAMWGIVSVGTTIGHALGFPLWGGAYDLFGNYKVAFIMAMITVVTSYVLLQIILKNKQKKID